jgi:hypothetical protein
MVAESRLRNWRLSREGRRCRRLWCGEEGGEVDIRRQTTDGGEEWFVFEAPAQTKLEAVAVVDYF